MTYLLTLEREPKKLVNNRKVEYRLQMHAQNGRRFDTWITLNNLTYERNNCKIIKSGKGNINMKTFNVFVFNDQKQIYAPISFFQMWNFSSFMLFIVLKI